MDEPTQVIDVECPECGARMRFRQSEHGSFYGCSRYPECSGKLRAHSSGRLVGDAIDQEIAAARKFLTKILGELWERKAMKKMEAYAWLAKAMGLPKATISQFDLDQCIDGIGRVNQFAVEHNLLAEVACA